MKLRIVLATAALSAAALIGLAACGPADTSNSLTPEASALTALGFNTDDVTAGKVTGDPSPDASSATDDAHSDRKEARRNALRLRRKLGANVEHGEVVVQTKQGDKTVDVQRGTVTAIDDKSVTVKSADGFTQTWVFGTPFHVIEHRSSVQASAVKVGTKVGVAGVKNGSTVTANLLVIPLAK
jgi:hypothetical protein